MRKPGRKIAIIVFSMLLASTLLSGCDTKTQGEKAVKFINIDRVMQESGLAEQQQQRLKTVNETLQSGLKMSQQNTASLTEEKRQKALLADQQLLNLEWQREQKKARTVVLKAITDTAEAWRKEHNLLAIFPVQSVLASDPEADISEEIVKRLKDQEVDFGSLPTIAAKPAEK